MHILEAINRRWDAFHPRLQSASDKILRIMARLVQVAAVEPQRLLLRRFPHIPLIHLPRAPDLSVVSEPSPQHLTDA